MCSPFPVSLFSVLLRLSISRCKCEQCQTNLLDGALEFRCCHEVLPALGKITMDGSIERIKCLTLHEDYIAMTNIAVFMNVGPLLKDTKGNNYHKPPGIIQNNAINE